MEDDFYDFNPFSNIELSEVKWGDPSYEEDRKEFIERMEFSGYTIVYPKENELLIDIDSQEQYDCFIRHFNRLRMEKDLGGKDFTRIVFNEHPSKSGSPRRHIHVLMPMPMTDFQRILWQAVLGSDPTRELLSIIRLLKGQIPPTLFCEVTEE